MSQPAPLSSASSEVDLLAPLSPPALLKIAVLCVVGGALGLGAASVFIKHAEARAVLRVGTVGMLGPVVPLSEVKARAESYDGVVEAMRKLGTPDPARDARRYRVAAETDSSRDGTVVTLTVSGPDEPTVHAVAQARLESLVSTTHQAFVQATQSDQAKLAQATANAAALEKAGAAASDPAAAASFQHWAGELSEARHSVEREVMLTRDSEVIDAPYVVDTGARKLLIAAVGCFAGLLLGLALTARPAKAS